MTSRLASHFLAFAAFTLLFLLQPGFAQNVAEQQKLLTKYLANLKDSPDDDELRTRIITLVQAMEIDLKLPDDAVDHSNRGREILRQAGEDFRGSSDAVAESRKAFLEAAKEFQQVVNIAPWVSGAYNNLAYAQENAGLLKQAAHSLKFCLKAGALEQSESKVRDIKQKIAELEVSWEKKVSQEKKDAEKKNQKKPPIYVPPNF